MNREEQTMTVAPERFTVLTRPTGAGDSGNPGKRSSNNTATGFLILNADDWGRDKENTDRTLECFDRGAISSVSAMVFMEDSQRASEIAREKGIDTGLHLNFTMPFSAPHVPTRLSEHQQLLARHLRRNRLSSALFHPGLVRPFEYVVAAQIEEFCRQYGTAPKRLDGHHHMHLCANVLLQGLLPAGTVVRRNFSFQPGEKGFYNRAYRKIVDRILARHHRLTDLFFSLTPLGQPGRLERIFSLAGEFAVEVETHPINPEEHRFLTGGEILRFTGDRSIASCYTVRG
jgi:hypothetical protein